MELHTIRQVAGVSVLPCRNSRDDTGVSIETQGKQQNKETVLALAVALAGKPLEVLVVGEELAA